MDPFMLHPVTLEMAVLPQGVSVMIAACVFGFCLLLDINQATPSEQFINDFNKIKKVLI